jgi:hypothetical protein
MGNLKDYATGLVAVAPIPADSGTSFELETGQGARMPATPFFGTLHSPAEFPTLDNAEKVEVTDVTGDVLTIVRAQGDTTAQTVEVGWRFSNAIFTADIPTTFDDLADGTTNKAYTSTEKTKLAGIATGATANTGDVVGPSSSTNNALVTFNGTTGKLIQDSSIPIVSVVTTTDTQTLTNKTLTSPVVNTPTGIVKSDVGLGNVDNTSDASKPVSTATQTALDAKVDGTIAVTVSSTAPTSPGDGDLWLDESVSGGTAVDTDSVQTLTNKTIDGADNTFSNIPLTALDNSDTGWIDMTAKTGFALLGSTENAKARMKNGVVYIQGGFSNTGISANGSYTIGNLPAGITAPAENLIGRFGTSSGASAASFFVTSAGEILLRAGATVSSYYKFGGQSYII